MSNNTRAKASIITQVVAALYLCFLLVIIYLANTGRLSSYIVGIKEVPFADTLGHFVLMGILSFFANHLLQMRTIPVSGYRLHLGSVLVLLLVIAEECSQLFLTNRTFSLLDLLADVLGIFFFGLLARKVFEHQNRVSAKPC